MLSAYHLDAIDGHSLCLGVAENFVDWLFYIMMRITTFTVIGDNHWISSWGTREFVIMNPWLYNILKTSDCMRSTGQYNIISRRRKSLISPEGGTRYRTILTRSLRRKANSGD